MSVLNRHILIEGIFILLPLINMDRGIVDDIDLQNRLSVLCALTVFENGIKKYVNDQFDIFHQHLQNQMKYIKNERCSISCSKHKSHLNDWCSLCASWRTTILGKHKSRHTMGNNNTNWSYVDSSKWHMDAREVQKCFNPDWCFKGESTPEDVSVLLGSMNNCQYFKQDVKEITKIRNIVSHKSKIKVKEKRKWCQMLINFLKDPDIWLYNEAKTASDDIMVFKQRYFIEMIETEKCIRLLTVVYDIIELNSRLFKLHERWNYFYHLFHTVLMFTLLATVLILQYEYKSNVDTTINKLLEIIRYQRNLEVTTSNKVCDLEFGLSFSTHLQQHKMFVGRHWLFEGIHQRMEESMGVLLVADTGYGKSAAMANIIHGKHKLIHLDVIYHLCISSHGEFQRADNFVLNIVQNLYCKYPSYGKILEKSGILLSLRNMEIKNSCKFDPVYCFDKLIIEPLSKYVPSEEQRLVLLIDALDECNTKGFQYSVLTLLQMRYRSLPKWIKLLITSKNDSYIIDRFSGLDNWHLYRNSDDNKRDLLLYCKKHYIDSDYLEYLQWNFVLVKDVIEKRSNNLALSKNTFPTSLDEMFGIEFSNIFQGCKSRTFKIARIFYEIIIASMNPLTKKELFEISTFYKKQLQVDSDFESVFTEILTTIDQYYFDKGLVRLKPFLQDWLISYTDGRPCKVNKMKGHAAISRFMLNNVSHNKVMVNHDLIVELFMHIEKSGAKKINIGLLNPLQIYVDKTYCGQDFYGVSYEPCHSILDLFASVVDSYSFMRKIISFSKSNNMTLAAMNSVLMNNTNSLIAILEESSLDFYSLTNMNRLKTFVNYVYQDNDSGFLTEDDITLLHIVIIKGNLQALKVIAEKEKDTLKQITASGNTAIQLAVMHNDLESFIFLTSNSTKGTILLRFAAFVRAYRIFNYLLDNGIHDLCVNCKSFQQRLAYTDLYQDVTFSKWNFHFSVFANRKYHTLLTELTCESILNYATRVGDQMIVESILRVSNETLECRDFHGLTPLAGTIVFQHPKLFKFLIERGASVEFRCKPIDVYERTMHMISFDIYNKLYTEVNLILRGNEYCPYGGSFGLLSLRWPSCEIMINYQRKNMARNILFDIDIHFKSPLYYLVCESELTSMSGLHNPYSCKMFLFLFTLFQKQIDQNQIDFLVESCNNPDIYIHLYSYAFGELKSSFICKEPRLYFRGILNLYFDVHIGDITENTGRFSNPFALLNPMRHIYSGKLLPALFPVKSQMYKQVEVSYKGANIINRLNPLFSIVIENKTISNT